MVRVFTGAISISSKRETDLVNITNDVKKVIIDSGIRNGIANILCRHTTVGLYINEDEPHLRQDVENMVEKLVPKGIGYQHDIRDENAHSHLRSILLTPCLSLPIEDGDIPLGTWQNLMLVDFDGPRDRRAVVQVLGE